MDSKNVFKGDHQPTLEGLPNVTEVQVGARGLLVAELDAEVAAVENQTVYDPSPNSPELPGLELVS